MLCLIACLYNVYNHHRIYYYTIMYITRILIVKSASAKSKYFEMNYSYFDQVADARIQKVLPGEGVQL